MNPYHHLVAQFARLKLEGKQFPLGGLPPLPPVTLAPDAPRVLVFAPHPDDECIIGGLALRLLREAKMRVINVAVTLGSNRERQAARLTELQGACRYLGFDLHHFPPAGLERVNPRTREQDPAHWQRCVEQVGALLGQTRPEVIFFPHDMDWNSTHLGTHSLVLDALKALPREFTCHVVETEFWGQMGSPNLMVESSVEDVTALVSGTSFHVGEVQRNPYHLLLPAWMQDNVRRGGELVGGQGGAAPDYTFATLYRLRQWKEGRLESLHAGGRQLGVNQPPHSLFL